MNRKASTPSTSVRNSHGGRRESSRKLRSSPHQKIGGALETDGASHLDHGTIQQGTSGLSGVCLFLRRNRGLAFSQAQNRLPTGREGFQGLHHTRMSPFYVHPGCVRKSWSPKNLWLRLCPLIVEPCDRPARGFFILSKALDFFYAESNRLTGHGVVNIYRKPILGRLQ